MEKVYNIGFQIGEIPCVLVSVNPDNHTFEENVAYYDHCHHYFEIHYVLQGSCSFLCEQTLVSLESGELLLIPAQMYHRKTYDSDGFQEMSIAVELSAPVASTNVSDSFFYDCFEQISQPLHFRPSTEMVQFLGQIREYAQTTDSDFIVREKLKISCNSFLLSLFTYLYQGQCRADQGSYHSFPSQKYVINNFFAMHYMSNAAKEALSQELHISTRQLHRIMQKTYGINYRQHLTRIRLKIAVGFLTGTSKSIADISDLMGYSSPANFSTFIKRATGKTPGQIRKEGCDINQYHVLSSELI